MAIDLTGISNVNEFYSHHYLDSLLEGDLKGLFSKWKEDDNRTPDKKLAGISSEYFKAKSNALSESNTTDRLEYTQPFNYKLLEALGYTVQPDSKYTHEGITIPLLTAIKRDGNEYLWMIQSSFVADDINVLDQEFAYKTTDNEEDKWFEGSVEEAIQEILRLEEPPRWLILLGGQKVYLIDRTKWGQGKYLLFDLDEIFGRKQVDTLKATAALLSKDALAPEEGNILHDELDEKSYKHAFAVSEDLKYGIRRAVELIGNEFVYYRSQISKKKLYGDEELATKLTSEALNYLYRLLFLFYAESRSEELNVVPMKSEEYRLGYSLESLRELEQVPLTTDAARNGYFLHESLNTLCKIVNEGYGEDQYELNFEDRNFAYVDAGFDIDGLQSPLFDPKQTPLLSSVKFRNFVLQEVIQLLSLSKEGSKQRGRISYAQLGINQLGAVYEGLLSYSGFFAQEALFEVKPANVSSTDETGQSYFVSESEIDQYNEDEFVYMIDNDGTKKRKKYERGSFIFRLAGRDREKSASYYTPEVLTKSLVKYSLKELLKDKTADDILKLTVCEPAMGSGAFLNESVNQLADAYLERKQQELGETISAEEYVHERQKVKAYIATNNIYGVDLNSTAAELAKVSLWLNTIYKGSKTPWFSARLAVGNSLVGARRQVFYTTDLISGKWHDKVPMKVRFNQIRDDAAIYHFLIPDKGMVSFDKDKVVKNLAKEHIELMKEWRNEFTKKFDLNEIDTLKKLSSRIDDLWNRHLEARQRLIGITKEEINVWGSESCTEGKQSFSIESKEKELSTIKYSPTSSYRAIKLIMDYWSSLWFWPIDKAEMLPTRDEFLLDISVILDTAQGYGTNIDDLINTVDRIKVVNSITMDISFLHWELEFCEIFSTDGGFDLILGNPPWLKLEWEEKGILSDFNPSLALRRTSANEVMKKRSQLLSDPKKLRLYLKSFEEFTGYKSYLNSTVNYHLMAKVQPNLYKSFITKSWELGNENSITGLLHPEGIFEDPRSDKLREEVYKRLIYHFQFLNELRLFVEIDHRNSYSINVYRNDKSLPISFHHIGNLFHPKTIDECFSHNGQGEVPGIKNKEFQWEIRGHNARILEINEEILEIICMLYEKDGVKPRYTRLPVLHSQQIISVLKKLAGVNKKLKDIEESNFTSSMLQETTAQKDEIIKRESVLPNNTNEWVLSGPHFYIATPFYKTPREKCEKSSDYDKIDLISMSTTYLPRVNYALGNKFYDSLPVWKKQPITNYFRLVNRRQTRPLNERSLITCIIPPGVSHLHTIESIIIEDKRSLAILAALTASIPYDFLVKSTGKSDLYAKAILELPLPKVNKVSSLLLSRILRLNCLTVHFKELWNELYQLDFVKDKFSKNDSRLEEWDVLGSDWDENIPLRTAFSRRQALIEIDVLVAISLNLDIDELLTMYKVQFPVLQKYEAENQYDRRGKLVTKSVINYFQKQVDKIPTDDPNLEGFILPFNKCEREADYRQAYEYFSKILKENS